MTSALGPMLGGWLVQNAGWLWAFFISAPLVAVVLFLAFTRLPKSRDPGAGPLGRWGAFVASYIRRHPEYADLVPPGDRARLLTR